MLNDINTSSYHTPIMLPQVLSLLRPERGGTYVDGTLGGGGHSLGILRSLLPAADCSALTATAKLSPKPPQGFRFFRISRLFAAIFSTYRTAQCPRSQRCGRNPA